MNICLENPRPDPCLSHPETAGRNALSSLSQDALTSVIRRSQLHFIHCLVPSPAVENRGVQRAPTPPQPGGDKPGEIGPLPVDIPALRVQLAGSYILEALRLHRAGKSSRSVST